MTDEAVPVVTIVEGYQRAVAECIALRAENKTLQAECDQWQKKLTEDAWPEIERLRAALAESEAENDQWQRKVAELWAEAKRVTSEASET